MKALHLHVGQEAFGHIIAKLLVDNFYIPPRYPNSHAEGAPFEHYGPLQSEEAIRHAGAIIEFVRSQMA